MGKHWDPNKGKYVNTRDIPLMFGPKGKNVRWVSAEQSAVDTRIGKRNEARRKAAMAAAAQKAWEAKKDKETKKAAKAAAAKAAKAEKERKKALKKAKAS
jgi:hypothetical protein